MRLGFFVLVLLTSSGAFAAFSNYNSILIGQEAAGMGGAYTALSGDASAVSFYNPAAMTRMTGATLSGTVSAYQKIDTEFGDSGDFEDAPRRINQGFFEPVPSAAGTVVAFGHFALGISIVVPDFSTFTGEIEASDDITSFLNTKDQSIWVGGSLALNISESTAVGFTAYYTAQQFTRSASDQVRSGTDVAAILEEKSFTSNSIVYIVGVYHQINKNWSLGASLRFPSLEVSGTGSFFRSEINTNPAGFTELNDTDIDSEVNIPLRFAFGVAYRQPKNYTISADITYHGLADYADIENATVSDNITHEETINVAVGGEYYFKSWLSGRLGLYTNFSAHPEIGVAGNNRVGDHIDMWGFSANLNFYTSENTTFTFGGFWTGGKGRSTQLIGGDLQVTQKSLNIFTMLVGSSYNF